MNKMLGHEFMVDLTLGGNGILSSYRICPEMPHYITKAVKPHLTYSWPVL